MQVKSTPQQPILSVDCGIFVALAAEVFCTYAEGEFNVVNVRRRCGAQKVVRCVGAKSRFLECGPHWHTAKDATLSRALQRPAFIAKWLQYSESEPECNRARMRSNLLAATEALRPYLLGDTPNPEDSWYDRMFNWY